MDSLERLNIVRLLRKQFYDEAQTPHVCVRVKGELHCTCGKCMELSNTRI